MGDTVIEMPTYRPTNGVRLVRHSCGVIGSIQRLGAGWLARWSEPDGILYDIGMRQSRKAAIRAVSDAHECDW